jgi:hypothetical protein
MREESMRVRFFKFLGYITLVLAQKACALEPELHCKKGWGERTWEGMQFHRYHLRAEHFPPNKKYCLIVESFDGVRTETFSYVSNKKGVHPTNAYLPIESRFNGLKR